MAMNKRSSPPKPQAQAVVPQEAKQKRIGDFRARIAKQFKDKVKDRVKYTGRAWYKNDSLDQLMREMGCQNPLCKNFENAMPKALVERGIEDIAWNDPDIAPQVVRMASLGGIPSIRCKHCKQSFDAVDLGLLDEEEAINIIKRVGDGEMVEVA